MEGPEEHTEEAHRETLNCMEFPYNEALEPLLVDLVVDSKTAKNWYEAK